MNRTSEWTSEVTVTSGEHVTAEKPHTLVGTKPGNDKSFLSSSHEPPNDIVT